ncbi:MAG: hypothetical protein K8R36_14410 [Planctomycetales bacterium]|nr:hypothetical protein [Planctomycetales bacterium]
MENFIMVMRLGVRGAARKVFYRKLALNSTKFGLNTDANIFSPINGPDGDVRIPPDYDIQCEEDAHGQAMAEGIDRSLHPCPCNETWVFSPLGRELQ